MQNRDSKFHNYVMTAIVTVGFLVMGYTILNWNSIVASHQRAEVKALAEAAELKNAQSVLLKKLTDSNDLGLKEYARAAFVFCELDGHVSMLLLSTAHR